MAYAVIQKGADRLIGVVGLTLREDGDSAEIGYWIGRAYWGEGFATEAVRRVLLHGFGVQGVNRVEATVFPGNEPSIAVLTKIGFTETGSDSRAAPARGGPRDVLIYSLTRSDFARITLSQAVGRK